MIIAQISDTHIALDTSDSDRRLRDFECTVADINSLDPAPDVIVHTGDVVHNGRPAEYAQAMAVLAKAKAPVYVLAGNRDDRTQLLKTFSGCGYLKADAGFVDYAVDDFPVGLVALDTLSASSNRGDFCRERISRLIDMMDAVAGKPVAVFTHHPPFEVMVGPDRIHFDSQEAMSALSSALQRFERVVALFSGHVHRPAAGRVGRIPAAVVPCIATTLRKGDYPEGMTTRPVYYVHRFDPVWGFSTESRIVEVEPAPRPCIPDVAAAAMQGRREA